MINVTKKLYKLWRLGYLISKHFSEEHITCSHCNHTEDPVILADWEHSGSPLSRQNTPVKFFFLQLLKKKKEFKSASTNGQVYCVQYLGNAVEG